MKLGFGVQYKVVIFTLLIYLFSCLGLGIGTSLENAGFKRHFWLYSML